MRFETSELICSEFLLLKAIFEVKEGGTLILLLLLVSEAESALEVVLGASEKLHLVPFACDEFDESSGASLEAGNAILFAQFLQLGDDLGEVAPK